MKAQAVEFGAEQYIDKVYHANALDLLQRLPTDSSTLLAAEQLGRQWIGCDLSKAFCRQALRRLVGLNPRLSQSTARHVENEKGRVSREQAVAVSRKPTGLATSTTTMTLDFTNKVYHEDARRLLAALPTASIDSVLADPMYGVFTTTKPTAAYDWGADPAGGDPDKWWAYHRPIYEQCRRVLRPDGTLAWAMGCKFRRRFLDWFGGHRIWSFTRFQHRGLNAFGPIWIVQTGQQRPIRFPDEDSLLELGTRPPLVKLHPCPKSVEEMSFLVKTLTQPGQTVLDPFAGTGSTLVAAALLGRQYVGCDLSKAYCRVALRRLASMENNARK